MKFHFKRTLNKMNHIFTHGSGKKHERVTRNPGSAKKVSSKSQKTSYPIINSFKPGKCVPLKIRGELQRYAKRPDNGVIQPIHQPHVSVTSYPVIVMTEKDLEQSGFKRSDSANFAASLSNRFVEPATFHEDIISGRLAVIPSDKTLRTLSTFDSMNRIHFHWGLVSDAVKSTQPLSSAKVFMLNNTVSLSDLLRYSQDPQPMHLDSDNNLIVGKMPQGEQQSQSQPRDDLRGQQPQGAPNNAANAGIRGGQSQQPQSPNGDSLRGGGGVTPPNMSNDNIRGGQQNGQQPPQAKFSRGEERFDESDKDNVPHLRDDGSKKTTPQSSNASEDTQQSAQNTQQTSSSISVPHLDTQAQNTQTSNSANNNPDAQQDVRQSQNNDQAQNAPQQNPNPNPTLDPNSQPNQSQPSDYSEQGQPENDQGQPEGTPDLRGEGEDPALEAAERQYTDGESDSRVHHNHEDVHPAQTPSEAAHHMQSFVKDAFYDPSLGIKIDLSDLSKVLKADEPFQFKIRPVSKHSLTPQLDEQINKRLKQMNYNLSQLHKKHMQSIMNDSINHLKSDANNINQTLDPHTKHTQIHNAYLKINQDYRADKHAQHVAARELQKRRKVRYMQQRRNYINVQTDQARADYDQRHQGPFDAQQRKIAEYSDGSAENKRMKRRSALKKRRASLARTALNRSVEQLSQRAENLLDESASKERAQYYMDKHEINQLRGANYKKEIKRARDVSYSKHHDNTVNQVKKRANADSRKWQARLNELRTGDRNDKVNIVRAKEDSIRALSRNNSNLRQQVLNAIDFAHKAGNKIPAKYAQSLKLKDVRYKNLQKTYTQQIQGMYRRIAQIENAYQQDMAKSRSALNKQRQDDAANNKNLRESLNADDSRKDRKFEKIIISVCALFICGGIGTAVISHSLGHSSARTHYVNHYIVEGSRDGSAGGGTHTTINNGNAQPSTNKSESRNSTDGTKLARRGIHNVDRSLMTRRPPQRTGLYIGTSTAHRPTSYMYVKRVGFYHKGMHVLGKKNHSLVRLVVTRAHGYRIYVKDLTNNAYYQFNTY